MLTSANTVTVEWDTTPAAAAMPVASSLLLKQSN